MEQHLLSNTEPTKIICPHCGEHECFEDTQRIDLETEVSSYMCVACGYTSTTLNQEGTPAITQYEELTAELMRDLRWVDPKTNLVWYPIVINFPSFGIIFPDGTSKEDWGWTAAPATEIPLEDQKKYPIPGQPGQFYTKKIDMEKGRKFLSSDFYHACKFIGFIKD